MRAIGEIFLFELRQLGLDTSFFRGGIRWLEWMTGAPQPGGDVSSRRKFSAAPVDGKRPNWHVPPLHSLSKSLLSRKTEDATELTATDQRPIKRRQFEAVLTERLWCVERHVGSALLRHVTLCTHSVEGRYSALNLDVEDSKLGNFKDRGRPAEHPIARLSRRVWAAMFRAAAAEDNSAKGQPPATSWATLEHRLVCAKFSKPLPPQPEAKGLRGVAREGNDPRQLVWRVEEAFDLGAEAQELPTVKRRVSGPRQGGPMQLAKAYRQISFDAVELGEQLVPGSSRWLDKPLWWLLARRNPTVEEVRHCLALSLRSLGLVRPTLAERRPIIGDVAYQAALAAPRSEILSTYRAALENVSTAIAPELLALLIALVNESYLTDEDDLYRLHSAVLLDVLKRWLSNPALEPLLPELVEHVLCPCLDMRPIHHLPPTDPLHVPMFKAEWIAATRTMYPGALDPMELPSLDSIE